MRRKIIGILVIMLMISSAMTTILFSDNGKVKASGEAQQGEGDGNLPYNWVWNRTLDFANVIHNVNWSENRENNIPKGRCWATAGENYTILNILWKNMGKPEFACGLTNYMNITIGWINGSRGWEPGHPLQPKKPKQYSSKIIVKDFNLTIYNNSQLYRYIPYSEMFPMPVGAADENYSLTHYYDISQAKVVDSFPLLEWRYIPDHRNVSATVLNDQGPVAGKVVFLNDSNPIPENQSSYVFILNENPSVEQKMENITDAGVILIQNETRSYTYQKASTMEYPIVKINGSNDNFTNVKNEVNNGSTYVVDNVVDNLTLVFSNFSNDSCFCPQQWVGIHQRLAPSNPIALDSKLGSAYYDFGRIQAWEKIHRYAPRCKGLILSDFTDTHFMTHAVVDWGWWANNYHAKGYTDRYWMPTYSINKSIGDYLIQHKETVRINGFIDQKYCQQTNTTPGVISHNVVAYRNITKSPNNAIAVLSNRIDGWWSSGVGDSGVAGAILLGIAKYIKNNNITPKYNLTFLFTTGEEYGMRGAQHYIDSHPNGTGINHYNFVQYICFDQLGFNYTNSTTTKISLELYGKNPTTEKIIHEIANQTDYKSRTGNHYNLTVYQTPNTGSEDRIWTDNCYNTISFGRDGVWDGYHRAGMNYSEGDSLKHIDRNDVNVTFELAWNVTRYFLVNPNCWFDNLSYEAFNTTGDTCPVALKTTYKIKSVLPNDKVMINATFRNATGVEKAHQLTNITTGRTGVTRTVTFTLPSGIKEGDYYVTIKAYNSTARINRLAGINYFANDSRTSPKFHLNRYHTLGDIRIGPSSQTVHDVIRASKFTLTEKALVNNITAYVYGCSGSAPTYQCMIYRASDGHLMGCTAQTQVSTPGWQTFSFSPKPELNVNTQYLLAIWGNDNAKVNYTIISYANGYYNDSCTFGSQGMPPQNIVWSPSVSSKQYSIFCRYTLVNPPPQITNVSHSPDTVGFGYNVTINADVTDEHYNITSVKVNITYPDHSHGNYTMSHLSGIHYRYVFNNTWTVGQYNYTIWATDSGGNINSSSGHHFHVSAEAQISVTTLSDNYTGDQYINLTDPPNPPENLTLVGRGLTWNVFYNAASGSNILEAYGRPVNYQEDNGSWAPINTSLTQLASNHPAYSYGYRTGNNRGLFGVYFKPNIQNDWPVAFAYNRSNNPSIHVIRSKLVGVGYVDPASNWTYQYLQNVQSSQAQTTRNSITYTDVFTGTDVTWRYGNTEMKEEITLSNATKAMVQSHPPSQYGLHNASSYLVFITRLDYQTLNLYNDTGLLSGNVTISHGRVVFKDALGCFKCALPLGDAYELKDTSVRQRLTYRIVRLNGDTYLLSGLKLSDLKAMVFPIVVDPTITVQSTSNDGYIYASGNDYKTVGSASSGTVDDASDYIRIGQQNISGTYTVSRGFLIFNTSMLTTNANISNATLSLYKKNDSSVTDFSIVVQNGQPTYPHVPLQSGDYNKDNYSGNGGSLNTTTFNDGWNDIQLQNHSWVTKGGVTKLCLRSSRDINGTEPTGDEYVEIYSANLPPEFPDYVPRLVVTYRNHSKIKNTGSTNIKGYLLIQVQFYYSSQGTWVVDQDTINETTPRSISSGSQLALDTIFNGRVRASDLTHGVGTYRVYAAFRDPFENVLKTSSGVELKAWWQFSKT